MYERKRKKEKTIDDRKKRSRQEIEKELETAKEGTEYYDRLLDKLKDEDLFDDIPCVVEYINKKCRETA